MNRALFYLLLLTVLWLTFPAPLSAAEKGILLTEEVQLKVADSFMAEGEYYRAVTEYKKFLILFPDSEQSDSVLFKIGMAYYQGDEFETAARAFTSVGVRYPDSRYAPTAGYHAGLCYWRLDRLDAGRVTVDHGGRRAFHGGCRAVAGRYRDEQAYHNEKAGE